MLQSTGSQRVRHNLVTEQQLQGLFPIQGSNSCLLHLLHWQADFFFFFFTTSTTWEAQEAQSKGEKGLNAKKTDSDRC